MIDFGCGIDFVFVIFFGRAQMYNIGAALGWESATEQRNRRGDEFT